MGGRWKGRPDRLAAAAAKLRRWDRALASAQRRIAVTRTLIAESKVALAAIRSSKRERGVEA
jgi:hypothetical protein